MDAAVILFLSSGLFLGWALGANDAANVFGTAVGTRMVRFGTAAVICSVFLILGAVISGSGAAHTLGKLGAVNALGGSFTAAGAAALAVYFMTKAGLPVSTTQAIVGAIIGWNLFTGTRTDTGTLITILSTWIICPLLAAGIAAALYKLTTYVIRTTKPHLLRQDAYTRLGLVLAGAFGAYSLGANNIANVMGVFVPSSPFTDFNVAGFGTFTSIQQLFLLGALAIAVGVITYSKRVMLTVGGRLLPLSPVGAWVAVVAHSVVLFLFASQGLESLLANAGLPTIPLVPVSSSQAVVGAVLGIGLLKGGRAIRWRVLGGISLGWLATPIIAGVTCFVGLFVLQNVFNQEVYRPVSYEISDPVLERLEREGLAVGALDGLKSETFDSAWRLSERLETEVGLDRTARDTVLRFAERKVLVVDPGLLDGLDTDWYTSAQIAALRRISDQRYSHKWILGEALAANAAAWQFRPAVQANKVYNTELQRKLDTLYRKFEIR
ncbi:MAG: inorganic phosphate transporter [Alphaproteobacteria bacterium]|nr:inorganic phosphate transporter [Alphaproteobacteria bacterium]